MLQSANKKKLRALGQQLPVLVQIGKDGLTPNIYENLNAQLEAHELVKVGLLKSAEVDVRQAAIECAAETGSEIVHMIGHTFLLYRQSKENRLGIRQ